MTITFVPRLRAWADAARAAAIVFLFGLSVAAFAGPGAHGPGGEHLDAPAAGGASAMASPRVESKSELFELVARLGGSELSTMINRFETNEPVLDARVEVATGALTATAKFRADHGDYAIDDPAMLKTLSAPAEHALIFTIASGSDSDLLEGTLRVTATQVEDHASGHGHFAEFSAIAAVVIVIVGLAVALWRRRSRNRNAYQGAGSLS